ncbi:uncharacterized protein CELE_C16D9.8 [Caenorhabditis elegans]|uniref:Uncharacterized protein n=1 Tax=Caenorhabditis elegans TaxID=6239 RepID=Q22903_CAEEL|nr:Uncharacterized protein CELE_C16D9.8 [Caenorhabditis elegans]CCD64741.1 Uncharacterized protein CELE_C16D9.8 [Caenorhabditis elegans]|eukprot:NP_505129.1 Uncharacterized protein CELE_C16D9.8 [Caenorhabditis elegans]
MISHTSKLLVLISIIFVEARGRYEYIEESDLPAFYSMRSAQMAQKAQLAPQLAAIPQDPYQQYIPYQMYQQFEIPQQYSPFAVYSPVYRPQAAPVAPPPQFQAARPAPIQYHPMAYYHHAGQTGQPQVAPMRKKSAKT